MNMENIVAIPKTDRYLGPLLPFTDGESECQQRHNHLWFHFLNQFALGHLKCLLVFSNLVLWRQLWLVILPGTIHLILLLYQYLQLPLALSSYLLLFSLLRLPCGYMSFLCKHPFPLGAIFSVRVSFLSVCSWVAFSSKPTDLAEQSRLSLFLFCS